MAVTAENTVALTHADGAEHHEPTLLTLTAEGWVYVGLTIFLLLTIFVAKAPKRIAASLDARIAETRRQLDEAKALRAEAEAILADAQRQQKAAAVDAEAIVAQAKTEAQDMVATLEQDARELIARRQKMAEEKIAAAERGAIADVRAKVADAAAVAAARMIREGHGAASDRTLVDRTIDAIGQRPN